MTTLVAGDTFWLLPAHINPIMVKVTISEVTPNGYKVDEPVGEVNNESCIFLTEDALILMHANGTAVLTSRLDTHNLKGLREFLIVNGRRFGVEPPNLIEKKRGVDWFNIKDLTERN